MKPGAALAASVMVWLSACGATRGPASASPATEPSSPATASSARPTAASSAGIKLVVGFGNIAGDGLPLWAAHENGNVMDVELQYLAGGGKSMAALLAGQSQMSHQGGGEAINAAAGGAGVIAIANTAAVYPFQLEVAKEIQSAEDLKGKKIGIASVGGAADVATRVLLGHIGLVPDKDVTLIATGDAQTARAALQGGAIQGSLLSPPSTLQVEALGAHPLFDLAALRLPNAQGVLTLQRAWYDANRAIAQRYVDELIKATVRLKSDRAFGESVIRKYYKLDDQRAVDVTYDFYTSEVIQTYPHVNTAQFADTVAQLADKNEKLKSFDVNSIIDDSLVKDAEVRGIAK